MLNFIITFTFMFCIWIVLSGKLELFYLSLGAASSFIVTILSTNLIFNKRKKKLFFRLKEVYRFISYCSWLLWEVVKANYHVTSLTLTLGSVEDSIDPHMFTFTTSLKTDFAKFILANSITLTPGTVTIRVHKDMFYVHAIDRYAAGDLIQYESAMEQRIARIFIDEV